MIEPLKGRRLSFWLLGLGAPYITSIFQVLRVDFEHWMVRSRGPNPRSRGQPFNKPRTKPTVVHSITTNYQSYIPRLNSTKQETYVG